MASIFGSAPRDRMQTQVKTATDRYNNQQGPMAQSMAQNYGRATEANYGDYTDIMNRYRTMAGGAGGPGEGGGSGGGGGGYSAPTITAGKASYNDPFNSYAGYTNFSQTGGFSGGDMAAMRARGVSPIRAAYANAERNVAKQRSLQGGYSPNAVASQVKMAREQGQAASDASVNVEAGLAQMRQQGRLAGLGGMSNIEGQRLGADVDLSKFNTNLDMQAQQANASNSASANAQNEASSAASRADQLRALGGMTSLYGTTPGMSNMFGNQLSNAVGQGGEFGLGMTNAMQNSQQLPGQFEQTANRVGSISNMAAPWVDYFGQRNQQQNPWGGGGGTQQQSPFDWNATYGGSY